MRSFVRIGVALVVLGMAGAAGAVEIVHDGMHLDLGDAPACVVLPRNVATAANCAGFDLAGVAEGAEANAAKGKDVSEVAMVYWRRADGPTVAMNIIASPRDLPTLNSVQAHLDGFSASVQPDVPYDRTRFYQLDVGGSPAVVAAGETTLDGHHGRFVTYMLFGSHHEYDVSFGIRDGGDEQNLRAFAGQIMDKMTLPTLTEEQRNALLAGLDDVGKADARDERFVEIFGIGLMLVVAAFLVVRAVRKKRGA